MARYHFNLSDGLADLDVEGHDLPDLAAARIDAARLVGQLLVDKPAEFWSDGQWVLTVTDDEDLALFRIMVAATEAPVLKSTLVVNPPAV